MISRSIRFWRSCAKTRCESATNAWSLKKNRSWKVQKLIGDVAEEHEMMTQLVSLQQMLALAGDFVEKDYDPLLWLTFTSKKQAAEDLLAHVGKAPISVETIQATMKDLNNAVMALIVSRGGKS